MKIDIIKPMEIEGKSFQIIEEILGDRKFNPMEAPVIKRVIHTSADFDYADNLEFSPDVVSLCMETIKNGCGIITDTRMAYSGINKKALAKFDTYVDCYMDNEEVAQIAKDRGVTRAIVSMEKASQDTNNKIFVIGNAPTALIKLYELVKEGKAKPTAVIGVPVGFVNVVESKEMFKECNIPYIIANGRKGGSNIAAAIINAITYMITDER